jgi:vacuolar-type H+-ATPase subunit D/Vma8
MGTIKRINAIYNLNHGVVDQIKVDQLLNEFEENLGKEFTQLIRQMVEFKSEMRPTFSQIYENLLLS